MFFSDYLFSDTPGTTTAFPDDVGIIIDFVFLCRLHLINDSVPHVEW